MTKTIDLHKLNVEQATSKVILALSEAQEKKLSSLEIITGYGSGALRARTIELLESENLTYIEEGPMVIVYFFNNNEDENDDNFSDIEYQKKFQ